MVSIWARYYRISNIYKANIVVRIAIKVVNRVMEEESIIVKTVLKDWFFQKGHVLINANDCLNS